MSELPWLSSLYIVLCNYTIAISTSVSHMVGKLYSGHRSVVFNAVQWLSASLQVIFVLSSAACVHVRTVCDKVEQKNAKQNNQTRLEGLQNFQDEGELL